MRLDLRHLPRRFPPELGTCFPLFEPGTGRSLVYVETANDADPANLERGADGIAWLVERLEIRDLAFDGCFGPGVRHLKGPVEPEPGPAGGARVRRPQAGGAVRLLSPAERYLRRSRSQFQGRVHGLDHAGLHARQVAAFRALFPGLEALDEELRRCWRAARALAPRFLRGPALELVELCTDGEYFHRDSLLPALRAAAAAGIDLSRFPTLETTRDCLFGELTLAAGLRAAEAELPACMCRLEARLTPEVYDSLASLRRECRETRPAGPAGGLLTRQHLFFTWLRECAGEVELDLERFPAVADAAQQVEGVFRLSLPGALLRLEEEIRELVGLLARSDARDGRPAGEYLQALDLLRLLRELCTLELNAARYRRALCWGLDAGLLEERLRWLGIPARVPGPLLHRALEHAREFYSCATRRARAMARGAMSWFAAEGSGGGVLLLATTGFLSEALCGELDRDRIACYRVAPRLVVDPGRRSEYYRILYQETAD